LLFAKERIVGFFIVLSPEDSFRSPQGEYLYSYTRLQVIILKKIIFTSQFS